VRQWTRGRPEFEKLAAFALLWSLAAHDKQAADELFLQGLLLIEAAAEDERNFVKKAVNMALRAIGKRNLALHAAALATARWIGKDALRELRGPSVIARLKKRAK
jgi:3-methyladenine DNA glycosylase AlkD